MSGIEFRMKFADGRAEKVVIESERVRIGSGAHCEVRLPPEQASVDHVLVTIHGGALHVQALALSPSPTINGSPFTEASLLPDSVLGVGQVQIQMTVVEVADNDKAVQKKSARGADSMVYAIALLALPVAFYLVMTGDDDEDSLALPVDRPSLWAADHPQCPHREADQARAFANDRKVVAEGKRERSKFVLQDGVLAVPQFEMAAACFTVAGDKEMAARMEESSSALRKEMDEAYHAHNSRLEHLIRVGDERTAQQEVKSILSMLEGKTGEYVVFLSNMDRQYSIKLGKAEEE